VAVDGCAAAGTPAVEGTATGAGRQRRGEQERPQQRHQERNRQRARWAGSAVRGEVGRVREHTEATTRKAEASERVRSALAT